MQAKPQWPVSHIDPMLRPLPPKKPTKPTKQKKQKQQVQQHQVQQQQRRPQRPSLDLDPNEEPESKSNSSAPIRRNPDGGGGRRRLSSKRWSRKSYVEEDSVTKERPNSIPSTEHAKLTQQLQQRESCIYILVGSWKHWKTGNWKLS